MKTHRQIKAELMKRPGFKKAREEVDFEFQLLDVIITKRIKNGLTQKQLAEKVGTKQSAIARFESGQYNPSLNFVSKLSKALDLRLQVNPRR